MLEQSARRLAVSARLCKRGAHLHDEGTGIRRKIQQQPDRPESLDAQLRHEARAEQRRLAQARLPVEHRERLLSNTQKNVANLRRAAEEIVLVFLTEGMQPEPRMVGINARSSDASRFHHL